MAISKPAATPIIISTVFPVLAILAVAGRFYARRIKKNLTKLDDWFAVLALVSTEILKANLNRNSPISFQIGCIANASVLIVGEQGLPHIRSGSSINGVSFDSWRAWKETAVRLQRDSLTKSIPRGLPKGAF